MGVEQGSIMLQEQGAQRKVMKITAKAVSWLSKLSVQGKPLRYESNLSIYHSPLYKKYFYAPARLFTYVTEDGYSVTLSEDTLMLTVDGWKPAGEVKIDDTIWTNGIEVPPWQDKESLRRMYHGMNLTQKEIAEKLNVSERTIRAQIHKFGLEKGNTAKMCGENNPNWKGDSVSKRGGYERTHEKFDKLKTGVCSRCGRELPTQLHHDDRNPTNISDDNLIELCDLCHASEHHGMVVKWTRPARIVQILYGGNEKSVGFALEEGDNVIIEGFILRFPDNAEKTETLEKR